MIGRNYFIVHMQLLLDMKIDNFLPSLETTNEKRDTN